MSYLIKKVEILYPRLDKTYRFDNTENRSIPCGPLEKGATYDTKFRMDQDTANALMQDMAIAYNEKRKDSWPEKVPMPFTKEDDGVYVGKCKLNGSFDGVEATRAPKHYDSKNNLLEAGFQLTTGSTANLSVETVPYHSAGIGTGVSLRLRSVQVLAYKPFESASPFEEAEGFESGSPFGETSGGFDSTKEVTPTIVFEEEVVEAAPAVEAPTLVAVETPVAEPKKKVKSKTAAPKDEVDLSKLVSDWDD